MYEVLEEENRDVQNRATYNPAAVCSIPPTLANLGDPKNGPTCMCHKAMCFHPPSDEFIRWKPRSGLRHFAAENSFTGNSGMAVRGGMMPDSRDHYVKIDFAQNAKKNRLLNLCIKRARRKARAGLDQIRSIR